MISIDDMMVFAKVAEKNSFTLAAEELGIGKARVSQIVTKLEQALNTKLLHRTTRTLSLTDIGMTYYQRCKTIADIAYEANTETQNINLCPSGTIRISTPNAAMVSVLSRFLVRYPDIKLDLLESDGFTNLIETRCDLALRASSTLEDSSLYATKLGEFTDMICATPNYLKQFPSIETLDDLKQLDWISHQIVHGEKQLTLTGSDGSIKHLSHTPKIQARTTVSVREFVLNHIGFAIMPSYMVQEELESGKLIRLLPQLHDLKIPIYAVYQDKALMPLRVRTLIDFLKQEQI